MQILQVSGVSNEIFRQIEMVENDHDSTTAAALEVCILFFNIRYNRNHSNINYLLPINN